MKKAISGVQKSREENDPNANIEKNNEDKHSEVHSDGAAEERLRDDSESANESAPRRNSNPNNPPVGQLNTEQDQENMETNSLNKQGSDVGSAEQEDTSAPFPSESEGFQHKSDQDKHPTNFRPPQPSVTPGRHSSNLQPSVTPGRHGLNSQPSVTSGHLSPNPRNETIVTSPVTSPRQIRLSNMQQEGGQAQGQGLYSILPQSGAPVFAVPLPYFEIIRTSVPCSTCGSSEKKYLQQMSASPTPYTPANNYAVHSSISHEVLNGTQQTFAQAYMGPPLKNGSSLFNNTNFIKMHPTNNPICSDASIQTEDHNKNKFADHNIYSDIPNCQNVPDSSHVSNKAWEQHPKRDISFLSQERQLYNDNRTDQSCQSRSSLSKEQNPYQDRSSVSWEQPDNSGKTVNQPRAYNNMPLQGYKQRGKGKTLVEDTTFFREDMKVVRHREISIWSRDKDGVKIPFRSPSRALFNILDRELEVQMQANRSREQSPEFKKARTRDNSRSPKTVQFSVKPDMDPLTDEYDEEGMYSMEEDYMLDRYENEAEMRREQTHRQKGQGMQILSRSPSPSSMSPSFSRSPKSATTSPNLSRSPSPIPSVPPRSSDLRSQRNVPYSLSCSARTLSPPVELEASISPQPLSSRSTSSQTDKVEEQTPPLQNQPDDVLVRNRTLETGMLHLYKTMNELLLSKILLEQKLENLTEEIKLQRLQSDDEERHARRTETVEYQSNDEYYTIKKQECLTGVMESARNLNWEPQSSQSDFNSQTGEEVKESVQGLSHKLDQYIQRKEMEAERHELKAQLENIQSKIDRIIALQKSKRRESVTEHMCSRCHHLLPSCICTELSQPFQGHSSSASKHTSSVLVYEDKLIQQPE